MHHQYTPNPAITYTEIKFVQTKYIKAIFCMFISPAVITGTNINILGTDNNKSTYNNCEYE